MRVKMNRLEHALDEIGKLEDQAKGREGFNGLPALFKLLVSVWYIGLTVSFDKYDLYGLLGMGIYPMAIFLIYEIPFWQCLKRIRILLPLLVLAGIANPFLDRESAAVIGSFSVSGGMLSFFTLLLKGFFTVLAGYLLMVSTSMEGICGALQRIHVPTVLVTMLLLTYRYITLLLQETGRTMQAYTLRCAGQKGVHIKAWGSFTGLLLLRSMDRAENVYESMCLRGFDGSANRKCFQYAAGKKPAFAEYLWFFGWMAALLFLRLVPVLTVVGNALTG